MARQTRPTREEAIKLHRRLASAWRYVVRGTHMPPAPPPRTRAAVLSSGELIVLPAKGGQLLFSVESTAAIRDALDLDGNATTHPVGATS